jgi:hypothetical protein
MNSPGLAFFSRPEGRRGVVAPLGRRAAVAALLAFAFEFAKHDAFELAFDVAFDSARGPLPMGEGRGVFVWGA